MTLVDPNVATEYVPVNPMPLSAQQTEWLQRAWAELDVERMTRLNVGVVDVPSPTGYEKPLCEWLVDYMEKAGLDSALQDIDGLSANAIGSYGQGGRGATLMLYAPVDTHLSGDDTVDVPWVGPNLRPDMLPKGYVDDFGNVIGLGAANPKALITTVVSAVEAVARAGIPLRGKAMAALCGGGMPFHAPNGYPRKNLGMGSGVWYMVQQGVTADFAMITKPGYQVMWEEAGLVWFKITTTAYLGYAGNSHDGTGYRNSIADMGKVVLELEDWFPKYTAQNTSGLLAPQGALGALRAGFPEKTALPPAVSELYVDLRLTPRMTPTDVQRQLEEKLDEIRDKYPGIEVKAEMIAAYPSAETDPQNWIVQSALRGWEFVEGKPHGPRRRTSGQTDSSLIRNLGIPLARVGVSTPTPNYPSEWQPGLGGMSVSYVPNLVPVAKILIYAIIDTCTRSIDELSHRSSFAGNGNHG